MRKAIAMLMSVVVISGIALVIIWPHLKMEFASSAHYTSQDKREYEYYTPELLKKCPGYPPNMSLISVKSQAQRRMCLP